MNRVASIEKQPVNGSLTDSGQPSTPASGRPRRAMIVTGEASGDLHGANLIAATRQLDADLTFFGVGGPRMAAAGCEILIPGEELAVMGLVEVIGHFPTIYRAFSRLKKILHGPERPDLLILIDFPDFNLRLARQAKRAGIPVLYYVSPQVWAWRRGRVKKIARVVDRLAVILPFEADFYRGHDIEVSYVGNPLLDEFHHDEDRESLLRRHGLDPKQPVVGIFPGSRKNELRYNLQTLIAAAEEIRRELPAVQFLLPVAPGFDAANFAPDLEAKALPVTLVTGNIYDIARACAAVMTVSGTVTLQIALAATPMAIVYKMAPLTYAIGRRLVKVPHIGLVNIVAGEGVVREFIQDEATAESLAAEMLQILNDQNYRDTIGRGLEKVRQRLGAPGCSLRVAAMASDMSRGMVRSVTQEGSR